VRPPSLFSSDAGCPSSRIWDLGYHEPIRSSSPLTPHANSGILIAGRNCKMKDLLFVGDSHRILSEFPDPVQRHVGYALYQAQMGNKHPDAKPLKSFQGGTLEVVTDHRGDTYRRGLHRQAGALRLRPACLPEEVEAGNRDAEE